jgi:hypothetical protein
MLSPKRVVGTAIVFLTAVIFFQSTASYAWDRDRHHGYSYRHESPYYHAHPYFGLHVSLLPREHFSVSIGGSRYYYSQGYYYFRDRDDYVIVNPPLGAVATTIPPGYQPVVINGITYYSNNGVYYLYTPQGYQVVPQPTTILQSVPVTQIVTTDDSPRRIDNFFTVNIPNDRGGYTAVAIKKTDKGYVGPQGEFYAEFPKVDQLKLMYAK